MGSSSGYSLSVIIATLGRPECVRRCLEHLQQQSLTHEVIVVDGSPDDLTRDVVAEYPGVRYIQNPRGWGRMTASRNIGSLVATGDVLAFIDDDAYAHPRWAEEIIRPYVDAGVGAVGGRALNGIPGEEREGRDEVGRLTRDGFINGFFAVNTGGIVDVDHIIGCNMSFRREVLTSLGGFHEFYPGFCSTYEEVDLCLRVKKKGYRVLFNPAAAVDHEGAPRKVGKRFDAAYSFRVTRNHATLLVRNYGVTSVLPWRFMIKLLIHITVTVMRRIAGSSLHYLANGLGLITGLAGGIYQRMRQGDRLVRRDVVGCELLKIAKRTSNYDRSECGSSDGRSG